jgi:hypothetical protein
MSADLATCGFPSLLESDLQPLQVLQSKFGRPDPVANVAGIDNMVSRTVVTEQPVRS